MRLSGSASATSTCSVAGQRTNISIVSTVVIRACTKEHNALSTRSQSRRALSSGRVWGQGRLASRMSRAMAGGADGSVGDDEDPPRQQVSHEELKEAVAECRELLAEATRMSGEQARAELTASFLGEGAIGFKGNLALDMARVQLFFKGKGMRPWEAEKVSRSLVELDSIYEDVELLAVKYDRLVRTLPDVDIKSMVAADPRVMSTDIVANIERLLLMFTLFPRSRDKVRQMVAEAPRLLYCDDVQGRLERTCACIKRVYPEETDDDCIYAVCEEPTLLFHLPDLAVFRERALGVDIAELPMTVQEMLVYATRNENE